QYPEIRLDDGCDDDEQIKLRNARPDFYEALEDKVCPATEISLHGTRRHADDGREKREDQTEQNGYPKAIDQPRRHISPLIVRTEPIVCGGRGGRAAVEVDRLVGIFDQRPHHHAARLANEVL